MPLSLETLVYCEYVAYQYSKFPCRICYVTKLQSTLPLEEKLNHT